MGAGEEQDQLHTIADAQGGVDGLGVVVDGVPGAPDAFGNLRLGQTGQEQLEDALLGGADACQQVGTAGGNGRAGSLEVIVSHGVTAVGGKHGGSPSTL